jgi:hypothetical protein
MSFFGPRNYKGEEVSEAEWEKQQEEFRQRQVKLRSPPKKISLTPTQREARRRLEAEQAAEREQQAKKPRPSGGGGGGAQAHASSAGPAAAPEEDDDVIIISHEQAREEQERRDRAMANRLQREEFREGLS